MLDGLKLRVVSADVSDSDYKNFTGSTSKHFFSKLGHDGLLPLQHLAIPYIFNLFENALILEGATGQGKSVLLAFAAWLHAIQGKRVLCLLPSRELATQLKRTLARINPTIST